MAETSRRFLYKLRLVCTDGYGANTRGERARLHAEPGWGVLHSICSVHKVHHVSGSQFKIVDWYISALIQFALASGISGAVRLLRQALRECIAERLQVVHCPPPHGAAEHHTTVLDIFLDLKTPCGTKHPWKKSQPVSRERRRAAIERLDNGDITKWHIFHHEQGCCENREDTLRQFYKYH